MVPRYPLRLTRCRSMKPGARRASSPSERPHAAEVRRQRATFLGLQSPCVHNTSFRFSCDSIHTPTRKYPLRVDHFVEACGTMVELRLNPLKKCFPRSLGSGIQSCRGLRGANGWHARNCWLFRRCPLNDPLVDVMSAVARSRVLQWVKRDHRPRTAPVGAAAMELVLQ